MSNNKQQKKNEVRKKSIEQKYAFLTDFPGQQNKCLGCGGNAKVFEVIDRKTNEKKALKFLLHPNDKIKAKRFHDEINILKRMKKDKVLGVVQLLDYSYDDFWYVMPLMKCSEEYVTSKIKKDINKIVSMFIPLVETFAYLHSLKIYHRDIKPSNIYVHNNSMIIGDFGLVDFPDKNENITESDRPLGAIFTMAPEMRRNPTIADGEKADVYSLAKTLWMFLTGEYKGFEGQYSVLDETHRLRKYNEYIGVHLVEIEVLLTQATSNAPELRPNMSAFLNSS